MRTKAINGKPQDTRQDTYLYGYPMGKQRFRSAQEFFPHLLWLATDESGNAMRNCSCRFCHPEAELVDPSKPPTAKTMDDPRPEAASAKAQAPPAQQNPAKLRALAPPTPAAPAGPEKPQQPQPNPAVTQKTPEQDFDASPTNDFIYRPGELAWFFKGPAWALGVVLRRKKIDDQPRFEIQPLGYPLSRNQPVVRTKAPNDMRPWLAWSVPPLSFGGIRAMTYEQVPWADIVSGKYGGDAQRTAEVDASIMAAKAINQSYSFFDKIDVPSPTSTTFWKGMFLGGEKIWAGEPIRLQGADNAEIIVMVVHQMIEKLNGELSTVQLVGDVYSFTKMPLPEAYKNPSNWPKNTTLPARMAEDVRWRNEVSLQAGRDEWREWKLAAPSAHKGLNDVKGRWYESRLLLPVLQSELEFQASVRAGDVGDTGLHMNSRVHMLAGPAVRKKNRLATMGASVPDATKISRGLDSSEEGEFGASQGQQSIQID